MAALTGLVNFNPDKEIPSLEGKVIFVTGGTDGIGKVTVAALAKHKPEHLYFTGRNESAAKDLISQLQSEIPGISLTFLKFDLSSLASVKSATTGFQHDRLDILICNGGVMDIPPAVSVDGFEIHLATNHLGHAMLIRGLLPVLLRTAEKPGADVRVVSVSSAGFALHPKEGIAWDKVNTDMARIPYVWTRYGQSKLANLVYATELARRYPQLLSVSIHPGFVDTDLIRKSSVLGKIYMYGRHWLRGNTTIPREKGALNQLWAAAGVERSKLVNGAYYIPVAVVGEVDAISKSEEFGKKLWSWTEEVLDRAG
ncbi:NAD(P)-binding protein [Thozetella sp. PMI_491]|nr:NAD(P)-binding protein [Thozetella sp. PMI_491]